MTFHQTIIIGNVGSTPELREVSGKNVCNFSVAVNETWRDRQSGEKREKTTWYRVNVWGNQAKACADHLGKGRQVVVTGNVEARGYMNNAGEAAASLELRARDVKFLGSGTGSSESNDGGDYYDPGSPQKMDIPF